MCKALEIVKEHKLHSSDSHDDGQEQGVVCVCVFVGGWGGVLAEVKKTNKRQK